MAIAPRPILALVIGTIALAGSCSRPVDGAATRSRPSAPVPMATSPASFATLAPAEVPEELRFSAPRLGGGTIQGTAFAGQDLVIWFWAPW